MKRYIIFLFLICFAMVQGQAQNIDKKDVAVYVEGDVTKSQIQIISSSFMDRITQNRNYAAYERNEAFLNAITKEHDFQLSGDVKRWQIRDIANKYGVDYVIAVDVVIDDNHSYMTAKLINLVTGRVIKQAQSDRAGYKTTVLKNLANTVAFRLIETD